MPLGSSTLFYSALHLLGQSQRRRTAGEFNRAALDPRAAQHAKLSEILRRNQGTEYGVAHGFAKISSPEEFAQVPLMTSADLVPLVDRLMAGERNLITADPPIFYSLTSGSTGVGRKIPITASFRAEFQKTVHASLWHLYRKFPRGFRRSALYFVGARSVATAADGNDIGTMSGFNFTELPPLIRKLYAWPAELFAVKDLKARSFLALLLATQSDPSMIAGIFPAAIVYLLRDLSESARELAKAARAGQLPGHLQLSAEQRAFFQSQLVGSDAIARRFQRGADAPEEEKVAQVWPSLGLVYCWLSSTAALYLPELKRRIGAQVPVRDAIYSSSEGWCSVPMGDDRTGGALAVTSHYFEFIEESAYDAGRRDALRAWELEDGKRYYVVVTNSGGLYRYVIGDIVEVVGSYQATPRIQFARRGGASCNLVGEKLDETHVSAAVGSALAALGLELTFFTLVPDVSQKWPRYRLLVEPSREQAAMCALRQGALVEKIEAALATSANDYGRVRGAGTLHPMVVSLLEPGSYDRYRQAKVAAGNAESQLKVAHLVPDAAALPRGLEPTG
jgi:hypothetical protein